MSDTDTAESHNGVAPAPPAEGQVPLTRLNEVLEQARKAREEADMLKGILARVAPQAQNPTPRVAQESPYLRRLKEEDQERYQHEKRREVDLMQLRAATFAQADQQDRQNFLMNYGEKAKQYAPKVEAMLAQLHQQGNFTHNRESIFKHMVADEALAREFSPKVVTAPAAAPKSEQAPPSDPPPEPRGTSTAKPQGSAKTIQEREAELENYEF